MTRHVYVSGAFDNLRSGQVRFLERASNLGEVTLYLWSDDLVRRFTGQPPQFPEKERQYVLQSLRSIQQVELVCDLASPDELPAPPKEPRSDIWVIEENEESPGKVAACRRLGISLQVISDQELAGFPECPAPTLPLPNGRKKVIVTGCYDWLHSGHIRFFEEVSTHGDLYVVVGNDENIRLLKGEGHPLFPAVERRYLVAAVRFVRAAFISSGQGWLDADPEIQVLQPNIYAVNEDGDRGGKREYCAAKGMEYLVLKRTPAAGLPARSSTRLRGY
jgi:cytidyltransferase-like protein